MSLRKAIFAICLVLLLVGVTFSAAAILRADGVHPVPWITADGVHPVPWDGAGPELPADIAT